MSVSGPSKRPDASRFHNDLGAQLGEKLENASGTEGATPARRHRAAPEAVRADVKALQDLMNDAFNRD